MSDILTPEEVGNELEAMGFAGAKAQLDVHPDAIKGTIDALAEALRAEHIFRIVSMGDDTGMDEILWAQDAANTAVARVAAWLEAECEHS